MGNNQAILEEYEDARHHLVSTGRNPVGINEHLESFVRFLEWKEKTKELFHSSDLAKDLI